MGVARDRHGTAMPHESLGSQGLIETVLPYPGMTPCSCQPLANIMEMEGQSKAGLHQMLLGLMKLNTSIKIP